MLHVIEWGDPLCLPEHVTFQPYDLQGFPVPVLLDLLIGKLEGTSPKTCDFV